MARTCSICSRSDAAGINERLVTDSARAVALALGLSHAALLRHSRNHLARSRVERMPPLASDLDPLDELVAVLRARALAGSDAASREYRLALAAQMTAKHATAPTQALTDSAEWVALRSRLLKALEPFPDARRAILEALDR